MHEGSTTRNVNRTLCLCCREGEDERLIVGCADGSISFFSASGSVMGLHVSLGSPITALAPVSSGVILAPFLTLQHLVVVRYELLCMMPQTSKPFCLQHVATIPC